MKKSHATRQINFPGFELGDYIQESIDFLRQHEPPEGYYVGFSGGKDSITTLELCRMSGVKYHAYYSCTRIDPPEMYGKKTLRISIVLFICGKMK